MATVTFIVRKVPKHVAQMAPAIANLVGIEIETVVTDDEDASDADLRAERAAVAGEGLRSEPVAVDVTPPPSSVSNVGGLVVEVREAGAEPSVPRPPDWPRGDTF